MHDREDKIAGRVCRHIAGPLDAQRARRDLRNAEAGKGREFELKSNRSPMASTVKWPTLLPSMSR